MNPPQVYMCKFILFSPLAIYLIGGSDGKESACNVGDLGLIPGLGRPGEGHDNPLHFSILAWRIPWTEEPGRLQCIGLQRDMTEAT